VSKLLTPRGTSTTLADLGERSAFVGRQRVGRGPRRRAVDRARRRFIVGAVAVLAVTPPAGAFAVRRVIAAPQFRIASIEVVGVSRLPSDRILSVAGIEPGESIFRIDPAAAAARLEAMPGIRRADVVRELPGRVRIVVEERRPFTLVHAHGLHWIDEDGYLIGEERQAVTPPLPVVSGLGDDEVGAMRSVPGPRVRAALALIRGLLRTGSPLLQQISEIDMSRSDGPVLYTLDGIEVRLGVDDWPDRLTRLEGVLAQVATQELRPIAVDLRFRDQVVLRRGGGR
jgi:cell division septal protein FtsQ